LLLALGSSRVLNGLRAADLDVAPGPAGQAPLAFNFGLTRHGPFLQLLCLNRLLDDGVKPRWVVLEVLPPLLTTCGPGVETVAVERQKWSDLRVLRDYDPHPGWLYLNWAAERAVPLHANRYAMLSRSLPDWVPWARRQDHFWKHTDCAGWLAQEPLPTPERVREAVEQIRETHGLHMETFQVSPLAERLYRATLDRCRAAGVPAVLLVMPESSEFRGWYRPGAEELLADFLGRLTREYDAPAIDARAWCPDDEFRDSQHLLPQGAARLTARLGGVIGPLLKP
jgi:hypothetical protein